MTPSYGRVLVQVTPAQEKTAAGIVIPDIVKDSVQVQNGKVLGVAESDTFFKTGMTVYFSRFSGSSVAIDGTVGLILSTDDILAYEQ